MLWYDMDMTKLACMCVCVLCLYFREKEMELYVQRADEGGWLSSTNVRAASIIKYQ